MDTKRLTVLLTFAVISSIVVLAGVAFFRMLIETRLQDLAALHRPAIVSQPVFGVEVAEGSREEFLPVYAVDKQPPITQIRIASVAEISNEVVDDELVIGVVVDGHARAYPINGLTGPAREILNDTLAVQPIAATW
jgi:hypothetical protein